MTILRYWRCNFCGKNEACNNHSKYHVANWAEVSIKKCGKGWSDTQEIEFHVCEDCLAGGGGVEGLKKMLNEGGD